MKKRTRGISISICLAIMVAMFAPAVFATSIEQNTLTFTQDSIVPIIAGRASLSDEFLNEAEYNALLSEISQQAKDAITPELREQVKEFREEWNNQPGPSLFASYDQVSLEAVLCMNDGLGLLDIATIGLTHANAARDEAVKLYSDTSTEMKRDAFRHMTWNFRAIKDVGESKTRIATINHEWAYMILDAVNAYETERYVYYISLNSWGLALGTVTYTECALWAKIDADSYAIGYRNGLIQACKENYASFNTILQAANIMDFWNNKVGRDYGKSHPSNTTDYVFTSAWNAGNLVKNESASITSSIRSTLYASNWWYI